MAQLWLGIVSLFPQMFRAVTGYGISGRAVEQGLLQIEYWNPRDFATDNHRTVDDRPYGGGPGMVMKVEPLRKALEAAQKKAPDVSRKATVIYLSPQGKPLTQAKLEALAQQKQLILLAGRYEGIDQRLLDVWVDEELSIGDYVLSGGELPAMVVVDGLIRLLPGALGHQLSAQQDSFAQGLLDCPHYTRPEQYDQQKVPAQLLSGNHEQIRRWRLKQALGKTWLVRPELLDKKDLDEEQLFLLQEFKREYDSN